MSITRTVTVHCDCCNQWCDSGTHCQTAKEARRAAKFCGWHRVNPDHDLCRECWIAGHRPPFREGRCADTEARRAEVQAVMVADWERQGQGREGLND